VETGGAAGYLDLPSMLRRSALDTVDIETPTEMALIFRASS